MNWNDMKVFLAITSAGSLKKAANQLGMHHTSVARRIKVFEQDLGVKLFDHLPGGYALTPAGESLFQSAQQIHQAFNEIEADLVGKDLRLEGDICLTIPHGFALHLLMPDLQDFMVLYPDVNLKIDMNYHFTDLANREADVAIRLVGNPEDSLAGRRACKMHWAAYASKDYLSSHDPINEPEKCHWLGWGKAKNHLNWPQKDQFPDIPVKGNLYSDVLQLAAIQKNAGIASLPCFIGDNTQGVQRVTEADTVPGEWIWILSHKDMATNARVRVLIDFLFQALKNKAKIIEGKGDYG